MLMTFLRRLTKRVLVVINIITGLLFLGGAWAYLFDPRRYWMLSLLTFILFYLLLILVFFFVFWLFTRPENTLIPLVFVITGWSAVKQIIPLRFSAPFVKTRDYTAIRVMSWNVELFDIKNTHDHPPGNLQHMLDLVNEYDPDIACFQEVVAGETPEAINNYGKILDKLHFRDNFYAYRLKDDFDKHHHFGTVILSKFPIIKKQFMVNTPENYNSTFQYVDLLIGRDTMRVFNIHLQSLKFSKGNRDYLDSLKIKNASASESMSIIEKVKRGIEKRAVQARFVKEAMDHTPYPIILCGDFNDVPVSYAYSVVGKGMQNAFAKKGHGLSRTFVSISPTLRIDNIFADTSFVFTQFRRINRSMGSDHFPIVADLKFGHQE